MSKLVMFLVGAGAAVLFQDNPELVASVGAEGSFFDTGVWFPILAGVVLTFLEGSDWPPVVKDIIRSLFKDVDAEGGKQLRAVLDQALDFLAYLKKRNASHDVIEAQETLVRILSKQVVDEEVSKK